MTNRQLVLAVLTAMVLSACGASDGGAADPPVDDGDDSPREITIGLAVPLPVFLTTMVGEGSGIFEEAGLDVTVEIFDGGPAATQALLAGEIDLLEGGLTEVLSTYDSAEPLVGFFETVSAPAYAFYGREGIGSWSDLDDARELVGVSAIGGLDYAISRYALDQAGLDPDDFEYTAAGAATQRASALLGGTIGMTSSLPPGSYLLEEQGLEPMGDLSDFLDTFPLEIYATTRSTLEDDPDLIERVQEAAANIATWITDNPDGAVDILQDYLEFPEEQRELYLRAVEYLGPYIAPAEPSREGHELTVDFYIAEGLIDDDRDIVLDTLFSYWDAS